MWAAVCAGNASERRVELRNHYDDGYGSDDGGEPDGKDKRAERRQVSDLLLPLLPKPDAPDSPFRNGLGLGVVACTMTLPNILWSVADAFGL